MSGAVCREGEARGETGLRRQNKTIFDMLSVRCLLHVQGSRNQELRQGSVSANSSVLLQAMSQARMPQESVGVGVRRAGRVRQGLEPLVRRGERGVTAGVRGKLYGQGVWGHFCARPLGS